MLNILRNILDETVEVYSLATLGGKLFIPFFIACIYLLLAEKEKQGRAPPYLVYPSLILTFILFNPVFIHLLYKFIGVEERIVRIYWPLPMDIVVVYCFVRLLGSLKTTKKKLIALVSAVFLLLSISGFTHSGESYGLAANAQKMPEGTKEICDAIYELNYHEPSDVIMTPDLFFWVRQYNASIRVPFIREIRNWYIDGALDLDTVGKTGAENGCRYVVLNISEACEGALESYGYEVRTEIQGQDTLYRIYMLQ